MLIVYLVNSQPKQLTSEESRYLRHQLQDVRDQINQLLDNIDCHGLLSVSSDTADSKTDGTGHTTSASNTAASFDALTTQKYTRDGTTAGSVDTGELPADIIICILLGIYFRYWWLFSSA